MVLLYLTDSYATTLIRHLHTYVQGGCTFVRGWIPVLDILVLCETHAIMSWCVRKVRTCEYIFLFPSVTVVCVISYHLPLCLSACLVCQTVCFFSCCRSLSTRHPSYPQQHDSSQLAVDPEHQLMLDPITSPSCHISVSYLCNSALIWRCCMIAPVSAGDLVGPCLYSSKLITASSADTGVSYLGEGASPGFLIFL